MDSETDDQIQVPVVKQVVIPYRPRRWQAEMHKKLKRFTVLPVHRGAGKSIFAINELIKRAMTGPENAEYAYILPLRIQAQRNVIDPLKRFIAPIPDVQINNATLTIRFPNGAKLYVLGANEPDQLRGIHLHYMVLDEVADMHPQTWHIVRPMLTNHQGGCLFIGTPRGHNVFHDLYQITQNPIMQHSWYGEILPYHKTNALKPAEIEDMRMELSENEFDQELCCSFSAAIRGAYYGDTLVEMREKGTITNDKIYDPNRPVITSWDLGIRDRMAVWFMQITKARSGDSPTINFIDYHEESNLGFSQWADILKEKTRNYGYEYETHIAPFDIKNRELGTGISRLESAHDVGIDFDVCPKQDVMDGIEIVRKHLPSCKFYEPLCRDGIDCLTLYRAKVDRQGQGLGPEHSVYSHAADSIRYGMTYVIQELFAPAFTRLNVFRRR